MNALSLIIVGILSASMSVMGSIGIIWHIFSRRKILATTYHRILFGMSITDIFISLGIGPSTLLAPRDTPGVLALGNSVTCNIQAFLTCFGSGAIVWYTFFLTIHYCISICSKMKEVTIARTIEPFIHLISIGYPLAAAISGVFLDIYHFGDRQCWISPYPEGCDGNPDIECTRGISAFTYRWIFQGYSAVLTYLGMPIIYGIIICKVWRQERQIHERNSVNQIIRRNSERNSFSIRRVSFTRPTDEDELENSGIINRNNQGDETRQFRERPFQRTKTVAKQGFFYVTVYYICHSGAIVGRIIEQLTGSFPTCCLVFSQVFSPLHGFLNYLVFIRTHVARIRKNNQERSFLWAFSEATCHPERHLDQRNRLSRLSTYRRNSHSRFSFKTEHQNQGV